jgi:hypothetical protein
MRANDEAKYGEYFECVKQQLGWDTQILKWTSTLLHKLNDEMQSILSLINFHSYVIQKCPSLNRSSE